MAGDELCLSLSRVIRSFKNPLDTHAITFYEFKPNKKSNKQNRRGKKVSKLHGGVRALFYIRVYDNVVYIEDDCKWQSHQRIQASEWMRAHQTRTPFI